MPFYVLSIISAYMVAAGRRPSSLLGVRYIVIPFIEHFTDLTHCYTYMFMNAKSPSPKSETIHRPLPNSARWPHSY